MGNSNAKKGMANILTGILNQVVTIAFGILIPRLVLLNLGSEANGLLNSVNQILTYLALLEAGISIASLQALYKPAATGDRDGMNRILAAANRFYTRTGLFYLAAVLLFSAIYPLTVSAESLSRGEIALVVLLSGLPSVINYFLQARLKLVLWAEGRKYVITNISTVFFVLSSLSKVLLLNLGCNVVILQAMYLSIDLLQVGVLCLYMRRHYRWLNTRVEPDMQAVSQSKNVVIHQVSTLIFYNTDTLILTWFSNLSYVSVYSMYNMLYNMISTLISNFSNASFILGQTFHTDRDRFVKLLDVYEIFNMALSACLFTVLGLFILPFLRLYTAGVEDVSYIDPLLPYLFLILQFLNCGRSASNQAISFAQHFKETQWRSILESVINVVVSIAAVLILRQYNMMWGMYGVLIGTIVALLYRTNDMIIYASRRILNRSPWVTYRRWIINILLCIGTSFAGNYILKRLPTDSYLWLLLWAAVSVIVLGVIFFGAACLTERKTVIFVKQNLRSLLKRPA